MAVQKGNINHNYFFTYTQLLFGQLFFSFFKNNFIIVFIFLFVIFFGCRKLVTDELPSIPSKPVINSVFKINEPIIIHLSLSSGFNNEEFELIENAKLYLEENSALKDTLIYKGEGIYVSTIKASQQSRYNLKLHYDNKDINAQSSLPVKQEIIKYEHFNNAGKDEEGISYPAIKLKFTNNPEQILYYEIVLKLLLDNSQVIWNEETKSWEDIPLKRILIPELINITDPAILSNGLPIPVFSNELIKGDTYTITINYKTGSYTTDATGNHTDLYPLIVELRSISYEYFKFVNQLYLYEQGRYPYVFGDVLRIFPLYSNVENGYGIFAGYSSCITDTIFPE